MTYNVFGGTLSLTQSISILKTCLFALSRALLYLFFCNVPCILATYYYTGPVLSGLVRKERQPFSPGTV